MAVQFEEPETAVVVFDVHHLPSVGLFAAGLAVRASPGQLPPVALAEVMDSVQLMVLQGEMCIRDRLMAMPSRTSTALPTVCMKSVCRPR